MWALAWQVEACWRRFFADIEAGRDTPDNWACKIRHGGKTGCQWYEECREYMIMLAERR